MFSLFKPQQVVEKKKITSSSLTAQTSSILEVFKNTISNLGKVVDDAKMQAKEKEAEIIIATKEKEALESIAETNSAIINKFTALLQA